MRPSNTKSLMKSSDHAEVSTGNQFQHFVNNLREGFWGDFNGKTRERGRSSLKRIPSGNEIALRWWMPMSAMTSMSGCESPSWGSFPIPPLSFTSATAENIDFPALDS